MDLEDNAFRRASNNGQTDEKNLKIYRFPSMI